MEKEQIYQKLLQVIDKEYIKLDEPMKNHTTFKIGGNADFFVTAKSEEILLRTFKVAKENNIPFMVIGNGSNLLVKDKGIRGIVIKVAMDEIEIQKQENCAEVTVGAGVKNAILAQELLKNSIAGFEFATGIPGTIGGAVYMNGGAYGGEMKDIVKEVNCLEISVAENETPKTFSNRECQFDYRKSIFQENNAIITKVTLQLPYGNQEEIKAKMQEDAESRKTKQPWNYPSAGSTFKRGSDFITAKLIDDCGLKGYHIGGAEVSTLHAGFLINKGNATANDVLKLVEYVKQTVFEKTRKKN